MATQSTIDTLAQKAEALRALHSGPEMLMLPNVWDAGSARVVAEAGFPAIATTSAGVANALGYEDHQNAPVEEMLVAAGRVIRAVDVPVTVDFEAGYSLEPEEIVERLLEIGAVGLNFEDTDHNTGGLIDVQVQTKKIAALKRAGEVAGVNLVVNARVDVFIQAQGTFEEQVQEGLRRAVSYREAGADCIYPIVLRDEAAISKFVDAVEIINVNVHLGGPLSLHRARELGIRRVSYAVGVYREIISSVERFVGKVKHEAESI